MAVQDADFQEPKLLRPQWAKEPFVDGNVVVVVITGTFVGGMLLAQLCQRRRRRIQCSRRDEGKSGGNNYENRDSQPVRHGGASISQM